jgi:hypothetical protein
MDVVEEAALLPCRTKIFGEASLSLRIAACMYLYTCIIVRLQAPKRSIYNRWIEFVLHGSTTWQQLVSIQDFDNELLLP